jgi:hypothetical protein
MDWWGQQSSEKEYLYVTEEKPHALHNSDGGMVVIWATQYEFDSWKYGEFTGGARTLVDWEWGRPAEKVMSEEEANSREYFAAFGRSW